MNNSTQRGSTREIVFIDGEMPNILGLLADLRRGVRAVVLDAKHDGIAEIARILGAGGCYDKVHLVAPNAPGAMYLGSSTLNHATLAAYDKELATIGKAVSADGDLLLYGENVALGAGGPMLLRELAHRTGADVRALRSLDCASFLCESLDLLVAVNPAVMDMTAGDCWRE